MDGRAQQAGQLLEAWRRFRRAQAEVYGDRGLDAGVRAAYAAARVELERVEAGRPAKKEAPTREG